LGVSSFIAGAEYAHGGISLQECLVPVIQLTSSGPSDTATTVVIESVTWKGLRCNVQVVGAPEGAMVDIRSKAAMANTTLVASVKKIEAGKASLAVADDDHMGSAALVVVLDAAGQVLQRQATTIGED